MLELESLKQGSKALVSFPNAYCPNKGKGRGGNASAQGGGDGDEDKPAGIPAREAGQKNICYEFRDSGKCKFGDVCKYSHDKAELAQSRKAEKAINAQKAEQKAEQSAGAVNTQTKGKSKDKGASAPEGGGKGNKGKGDSKDKDKLRRAIMRGETCVTVIIASSRTMKTLSTQTGGRKIRAVTPNPPQSHRTTTIGASQSV